jgi:hypothetical protein
MEVTCFTETSVDFNGLHGVIPQKINSSKILKQLNSRKNNAFDISRLPYPQPFLGLYEQVMNLPVQYEKGIYLLDE